MKQSKAEVIQRGATILSGCTGYMSAQKIADQCHISVYRVYSAIRALRTGYKKNAPIGVHAVSDGYILSEYATKQDDVEMFRRLNGSRTSVYIIASASAPHISKRWNTIEDKKAFELIMKPFTSGGNSVLKQGIKLIMDLSKKVGV